MYISDYYWQILSVKSMKYTATIIYSPISERQISNFIVAINFEQTTLDAFYWQ